MALLWIRSYYPSSGTHEEGYSCLQVVELKYETRRTGLTPDCLFHRVYPLPVKKSATFALLGHETCTLEERI